VLVAAVRDGRLTKADVMTCCLNGKALTERIGQASPALRLTFRTLDDFYRKHQPDDGGLRIVEQRVVVTQRGRFVLNVSNVIELWRAETVLTKEPETIAWLDATISGDSVLYDIGANVGVYSLYAAHLANSVRVIAFEPEPLNFAALNGNIHANAALAKRILAYPIALHESFAISRFFTSTFATGKAENWSERDNPDQTFATHAVGCVSQSLDEVVRAGASLPPPTHLKIDVDGPELSILRGAQACLARRELAHVLVELADSDLPAATALLAQLGFVRTERTVHQTIDGVAHGNAIFVKRP
jgi:FkbM family methyltransferase